MEITGWKIISFLTGSFFIGLIFMFLHWSDWRDREQQHVAFIQRTVNGLEQYWDKKAGVNTDVRITYNAMEAHGFPLDLRIRLLRPSIEVARGNSSFSLRTNYLDFIPEGDPGESYRLDYPTDVIALDQQGGRKTEYFLHVERQIPAYVRRHKVGNRMPTITNEYGIIRPALLKLLIDRNDKSRAIPFTLTPTEQILWRPLPASMAHTLFSLQSFLRRSMQGL